MKPISVLTATTLVAGALAVPTATAAQIPALASGELNWPIKESFISYVQKPFAKGKIEATDGAVLAGKTFKLPVNASASKVDARVTEPSTLMARCTSKHTRAWVQMAAMVSI